jgi:hypothetical protein
MNAPFSIRFEAAGPIAQGQLGLEHATPSALVRWSRSTRQTRSLIFKSSILIYIQSFGVATPSTSQLCARSLKRSRVVRRQSLCTLLIAPRIVLCVAVYEL